jgi:hypothetical protein
VALPGTIVLEQKGLILYLVLSLQQAAAAVAGVVIHQQLTAVLVAVAAKI